MTTTSRTLAEERRKAQFDVPSMMVVFAGGQRAFDISCRLASLASRDPALQKDDRVRLNRQDLFKSGLKKAAHVRRLVLDHNLSEDEAWQLRLYVDERSYADLHWNMFVPALEGQATEMQKERWLPLAKNMKIIGAYVQTELGHGSNVQGLETTATFDPHVDEFIINSPNLTSTKWWPGGLGKVATHALVYARLIVNNEDYGVHAFIVQIRSLEDHTPLPGIIVGDIGMKFGNGGTNTVDNGFLHFAHVHIPRENMLMRMAEVTREGKYIRSQVPQQIVYGAMIAARKIIILEASISLSRAVTIAVRYSAVRRQFGAKDGMLEVQVIDYMTQQRRLFPLLATVYAFQFAGEWIKWIYKDMMIRFEKKDFSTLSEVHACTAGMKALTTSVTADGIEECRKLCGGHGYLCSSGLPELYAAHLPSCTYEGDNIVMLLQVGRFLLKTFDELQAGKKPVGTTSYLGKINILARRNCQVKEGKDWMNPSILVDAFEARSGRLIQECAMQVLGMPDKEAGMNEFACEVVNAARAHCELVVVSKFVEKISKDVPGWGVKQQLQSLCFVYGLSLISGHLGEFLSTGYLTSEQAFLANFQLRGLLVEVRPNVTALVDAFNHSDQFLGSVLGRYDGDVYTHLYKEVWKEPLNHFPIPEGYKQYIQPILKQQYTPLKANL